MVDQKKPIFVGVDEICEDCLADNYKRSVDSLC